MTSQRERTWQLPPPVRGMRAAFVFFTRLPAGGFPYRDDDWKWAAAHAPLVGLVLGVVLGQLGRALLPLGASPSALLVVGASMLLTGALHEDGLADTSDALGGGANADRILLILKDSRIGAFGAAALTVSIVGRSALLAQLGESVVWVLPLVGCAARVGPVWLMATVPYVTPDASAKSRPLTRGGALQALVASGWLALLSAVLLRNDYLSVTRSGAVVVALAVTTTLTGWRYWSRLRGITGDFLGATEQLGELAMLAVLAWRA